MDVTRVHNLNFNTLRNSGLYNVRWLYVFERMLLVCRHLGSRHRGRTGCFHMKHRSTMHARDMQQATGCTVKFNFNHQMIEK